ncbi:antirestriction protein [Escherichia sp. E4385]|uniref:antirestriction protein n=1 Tax=Escherichia sp. E4385 TaxID=2040639 RepID=UPI001F0D5133|nr:antirestriction protein [Escherichia sp. E4385]
MATKQNIRVTEHCDFDSVFHEFIKSRQRESFFYDWADELSVDYCNAAPVRWEGRGLSNNSFYTVPIGALTYRVSVPGNGYEGAMTAEAFGITLSLLALGELSILNEDDEDIRLCFALRDYALKHAESVEIMAALSGASSFLMLEKLFSIDALCELANLEGELLTVAAYERLGLKMEPDESNITDNQWQISRLARTFIEGCNGDLSRYKHPSCKAFYDEVIKLARTVCPGVWDFSFQDELNEWLITD